MHEFNEAATAIGGGNLILTALFWAAVAFAVWIVWTGKWKALVTAANPGALALGLGKEAIGELIELIQSRSDKVVEPGPIRDTGRDGVAEYIRRSRQILEGIPPAIQLEILSSAPDHDSLYKAALEHFRSRVTVKESEAANG